LLPVAPGDREQRVRDTLWVSTVEGAFTTVFINWTSGAVLTGFLIHLGAGSLVLAAAASVPMLMQMGNPLLAWLANRSRHRLNFIGATSSIGRGVWLLAVLLPLLGLPVAWWPLLVLGILAFSSFFQTASGLIWVGLMGEVVPEEERGRYFGWRNSLCGVVGMLAGLSAGWYLDHTPAPAGFQMVLLVAILFATVGIALYPQHFDPGSRAVQLSLRDTVLVPLRDPNFRRFMIFAVYWNASVMLASPFVIPYFLKHLHMSFTQVAIWSGIASLCGLILGPMWGRVADRMGHKTVLIVTTILAGSLHPLCWMLATPGFLWFIWLSGLVDALSWGGINTAMFNLTLTSAPARYRVAYISVLGMVTGLAGCLAALLSGPLLQVLLPWTWHIGSFTWTGYHSLLLIAGLLRTQAWRLLRLVHEARSRPTSELLHDMWSRTLNRLPWRL
jgi:MFS family permease